MITKLNPNQIFVFGSNLAGIHGKGAAAQARIYFGARLGKGEGLQGQSYAFPTLTRSFEQVSERQLQQAVSALYACCDKHPELEFLLTKVGCGLAGFTEDYMKSLFIQPRPVNLIFPEGW